MGEHLVKKLPVFLNTPVKIVTALGLIVLASETLLMTLIGFQGTHLKDSLPEAAWMLIDSIVLTAIASAALYILIVQPMRYQQAKLEQQLDELRRFQKLTVGRELRMKELAEENAALRKQIAAAQPGGTKS